MVAIGNVVGIVLIAAGFTSSLWMLKVTSSGAQRLLKRQLFHQAVATLLFHGFGGAALYVEITSDARRDNDDVFVKGSDLPLIVNLGRTASHWLVFVCCLVEVHIAASIAAAALRSPGVLLSLSRWLPGVWPFGMVYGMLSVVRAMREEDCSSVACSLRADVTAYDPVGSSMILSCFALTFVFYISAIRAARKSHAPDVALQRIRRRAMVYPTIFMLTGLPMCARYFKLIEASSPLGALSFCLELLQATLNAIAYRALNGEPSTVTIPVFTRASRAGATEMTPVSSQELAAIPKTPKTPKVTKVVGFSTKLQMVDATAGGSWRRGSQWTENSTALEAELEQVRKENNGANGDQNLDTTALLWQAYVGTD